MELVTARLRLRPVGSHDLDAVIASFADARVMEWLGGVQGAEHACVWLERQIAHWTKYGFGRFAITCDGTHVGFAGLSRFEFDQGIVPGIEVAWRLARERWGKGYATEAARAILADGFGQIGLSEIIAVTAVGNARSRRVIERLGMVHAPVEAFERPSLPPGHPGRAHEIYRLASGR